MRVVDRFQVGAEVPQGPSPEVAAAERSRPGGPVPLAEPALLEGVGDLAEAADLLAALESRGLSDPRGLLGLGALGRGGPDHLVVRRVASRESSGSLEHPEAHLEELRLRATARLGLLQVAVENRALRDPGLLPACWGMHHLLQPLLPLRAFGPWCPRANGRWSGIKTSACFLHQAFTTAADPEIGRAHV